MKFFLILLRSENIFRIYDLSNYRYSIGCNFNERKQLCKQNLCNNAGTDGANGHFR